MTHRREFDRRVRAEIILRATKDGLLRCEECGSLVKPGRFNIDHIEPDGLQIDKSRKLTAADGKLLCAGSRDTCHGRKTAEEDVPAIAQAVAREQSHIGAKMPKHPITQRPKQPKPEGKSVAGVSEIARRYR